MLDYVPGNPALTAGGLYSHRMPSAAVDVLGPDRVTFDANFPGAFGGLGGARAFVDQAPDERGRDKLGLLNSERVLRFPRPAARHP
ncbi:hypothetical protein [Streptomyces sp. IB2014 016-6]|uniref:hypothetical protein n=1 Tax=Streptomyces sp. IB2014 016-6 TaxID=2517818 RepID=UPI0011C73A7A|nr:hypothetical protein [Streptomyces sp. IB2014 016-6]TXL86645.1 hypothetical protein EW053_25980 [Streptomyces sp. IB2014 016-6]